MRISDWSSDVCSSDLLPIRAHSALIMQMALPRATIQDNEKLSMTNADSCGPSAKPPSCAAGIKTAALPPSSTAATVPMKYEVTNTQANRTSIAQREKFAVSDTNPIELNTNSTLPIINGH